ncbi:KIN14B-interacting protein At4g14310 isoform X2 [Arabidopsis lyrata subsp. lyrata]|uniref:KIN14B-interacting protein At4g14310 isoform X2 n=1 Tax=Arabidopsis lyrata subsp. lyrata TaxID=81972 RepID=UPI000A29D5E0|nr:KIN14B-interacting protein At4g14310 isoform X2 [Arabidopsis lyrata subsp. lyrata]|eukprot:XP_020874511.1 KIN14B-interacting protein At4g14310 isoform X2 [Arabidopsis lyrata subsp. lyrata]
MSASTNRRRLKDINTGAGENPSSGKKPSRSVTPLPISSKNPSPALQKSLSSKENPNPKLSHRSFGSTQKPVLRPVPRIDKSAVRGVGDGSEGRVTRSTSSGLRGRSSSPSDLIRVFSDLRKRNESRVIGEKGESDQDKKSGFKSSGFKQVTSEIKVEPSRVCEKTDEESIVPVKSSKFEGSSVARNSISDPKEHALVGSGEKSAVVLKSDCKIEKIGKGTSVALRRKSLDNGGKAMEVSKEIRGNEGSSNSAAKYPSKLHEKLAFLEGKVKKIASDIKKTKDMLDLNNPDSSKVIISDIQQKITGIEKSMSHVIDGPEKNKTTQVTKAKTLVKGLNKEELEDRLFPHQRLLRSRTQPNKAVNVEEKPSAPVEENVIALEFLASLDKEKVTFMSDQNALENLEVQEMDTEEPSKENDVSKDVNLTSNLNEILRANEALEEIDDEENREEMELEEIDEGCMYQLNDIGSRTSTGGWFVSEGEAVILAHDDGSCSYYDVANSEVKSVYSPPDGISPNTWRDCWVVRAPGADGCSGRYVVAASAGNTLESGFCSWDFYTKDIKALHIEDGSSRVSRTALAPLPNNTSHGRNTPACAVVPETQQWWYRPCGPLIASTGSFQSVVKVFDIRDGEQIMRWEVQDPVSALDYSSPLQWRNRGKLVIAESEAISVWDVNSLHPEAQHTISSSGRKISAFHINNTDAEVGGGVRQRVSSLDAEGNDGVFCTSDSINILDFRNPSGIGAKIPKLGVNAQCVSSRGDSVFLGCTNQKSTAKKHMASSSQVQQFSIRKQRLVSTYSLPDSNSHPHHSAITQVWGNSNFVMATSGMGLFVFDTAKEETLQQQPLTSERGSVQTVREIIGPNDLYCPSFDYSGCRVLLISRDRPALWRYLL